YVFDTSGSMAREFPGASSKTEFAKEAVVTINNQVAAMNPDNRVGAVTFTTTGSYYYDNGYYRLNIVTPTVRE
ncbi:MAG: VWA domain-containing protein, partial [Chloroflexi bacterium]|nr:VWA domain-containing protein [Chloroflexota bacterium]